MQHRTLKKTSSVGSGPGEGGNHYRILNRKNTESNFFQPLRHRPRQKPTGESNKLGRGENQTAGGSPNIGKFFKSVQGPDLLNQSKTKREREKKGTKEKGNSTFYHYENPSPEIGTSRKKAGKGSYFPGFSGEGGLKRGKRKEHRKHFQKGLRNKKRPSAAPQQGDGARIRRRNLGLGILPD